MTVAEDREPTPELPLTGRCMGEAVPFEVADPLIGALSCHCFPREQLRECMSRAGFSDTFTRLVSCGRKDDRRRYRVI